MKKLGIGLLGGGTATLLVTIFTALGVFFFPLGYAEIFYIIKETFCNGSYWGAVRVMYVISIGFMVTGAVISYLSR